MKYRIRTRGGWFTITIPVMALVFGALTGGLASAAGPSSEQVPDDPASNHAPGSAGVSDTRENRALDFEERTVELNQPFAEWGLRAPDAGGNRFDIVAHAIDKPQFQEDRFRIREHPVFQNKDYTPEMTIRGLWHSTMPGGVANIWGNLLPARDVQASRPYDNGAQGVIQDVAFTVDIQEAIATYRRFWFGESRFSYQLVRENGLTGNEVGDLFLAPEGGTPINVCVRNGAHTFYVFYIEDNDSIRMDLSEMNAPRQAYAVDTRSQYSEHALGLLNPDLHVSLELPHRSDWAIVVGEPD